MDRLQATSWCKFLDFRKCFYVKLANFSRNRSNSPGDYKIVGVHTRGFTKVPGKDGLPISGVDLSSACHTGVPCSKETAPPQDPTEGKCLWSYGGPREGAVSYERGTPVAPYCIVYHHQPGEVAQIEL